jgi:D-glycero-alpha-D-manno-heptose-7-phosphate kinase
MIFQSALTLAPLRVSFVGGGTDFKSYYSNHSGIVISTAIKKYVYVHVKRHDPLFQEKYRISYSTVEHCQTRDEIQNLIVRSSLELLGIDEPLQISISSDLPSNSGLGSSSSFAVALLLGLHSIRGEQVSASQLATEACEVEIKLMKSPIGKQDQYAASFGGFNCYEFLEDESIRIEPINITKKLTDQIFNNSIIVWTGKAREANIILRDQEERINDNLNYLNEIKNVANKFKSELIRSDSDVKNLGRLIGESWELKKKLSPLINDGAVGEIINQLSSLDSIGLKLLGAGGGGFIFVMFQDLTPPKKEQLSNLSYFSPEIDFTGARVVSVN